MAKIVLFVIVVYYKCKIDNLVMPIFQRKRFRGNLLWRAVASGLGLGFAPVAPGTFGSLLALPLWFWGGGTGPVHYCALAGVLLLSVPSAHVEIRETGRRDPPSVVIDEGAGMLLAATGSPPGGGAEWGWRGGGSPGGGGRSCSFSSFSGSSTS